MKKTFLFELCAETLQAVKIAQAGGADRVELCNQLSIGGITPEFTLMSEAVRAVSIPVHVLIRPRGGDFVYNDEEFTLLRRQTLQARSAGAAGVAIGILLPNGHIDVERTRIVAELASPMKITFHRAFDEVASQTIALEDVILAGADCLLTSGGKPNVLEGAEQIASLRRQAADRITVMAGGGLSLANLLQVMRLTGVSYIHGSLIRKSIAQRSSPGGHAAADPVLTGEVLLEDVKEAIRLLNSHSSAEPLDAQLTY